MSDNVNAPSHYCTGKFECIEVMREALGDEAVKGFCLCNAFKYIYRHNNKNGDEDIAKADWYLKKYLSIVEDSTMTMHDAYVKFVEEDNNGYQE